MPRYHFNIAGGQKDVLGLCAEVITETKQEAVKVLQNALDTSSTLELNKGSDLLRVGYVALYLYPEHVTEDDIDHEDPT
jgi:hypothetical protein